MLKKQSKSMMLVGAVNGKDVTIKTSTTRQSQSYDNNDKDGPSSKQDSEKDEMQSPCIIKCPVIHCDDDLYTFRDRILHHKCSVVKLVRNQMNFANNTLNTDIENLRKSVYYHHHHR